MRRSPILPWLARLGAVAISAAMVLMFAAPAKAGGAPMLVRDINPGGSSNPTGLTNVGGTLFFAATDGSHGRELWKSDGTTAGTRMVRNIRAGRAGSKPSDLTDVAGTLYFIADDGVHGQQIWKSDGTRAGTVSITHLTHDQWGPGLESITPVGDKVFFFAAWCCTGGHQLYVTDGTTAGTKVLDTLGPVSGVTAMGGKLYYGRGDDAGFGAGLWVSNGTVAGTRRIPGSPVNATQPTAVGDTVFFFAGAWDRPIRLWKTDGTRAGTTALTTRGELGPRPGDAELAVMGGKLYFVNGEDTNQVWKSNGTTHGTRAVTAFTSSYVTNLTAVGAGLFFSFGLDLWWSDGTRVGTTDLAPVNDGDMYVSAFMAVGSGLCFAVSDLEGSSDAWTLWQSDGTTAGTVPVASFVHPPAEGDVARASIGATLYFAADDGIHGNELWSYIP